MAENYNQFQEMLRTHGFHWENAPNGSPSISSPMRIAYRGTEYKSADQAWSGLQGYLNQAPSDFIYTGPIEMNYEGEQRTFVWKGRTQQAGA